MKRTILIVIAALFVATSAMADDLDLLIADLQSVGIVNAGARPGSFTIDLNENFNVDTTETFDKAGLVQTIFTSINDFPESVQILFIKAFYSNYNINLETPEISEFINKLGVIASGLSKKGVHPLQEYGVYYLPDNAGSNVKTTDIELYPDGTIKQIKVQSGRFFDLVLPDGQKSQPRSVAYDKDGNIRELICDDRPITITTPDKQTVKAGIISYNDKLTISSLAKFTEDAPITIQLPDGQLISNPRTVVFSDNGTVQQVYSSKEKPISWKFKRGDKVIRRYNSNGWREAIEFFNVDKTVDIVGGIELTDTGAFYKYWQDQIGGYF